MKKNKFNLKRILSGIGFMLVVGTAQAQFAAPSGSTHCTVYQDDCTMGSKVQVTFTINTGGISPIDPIDEYQAVIKLYRGEWTPAGWAFTVINEINTNTSISPIISSPATFSTLSFFTTGRIYSVNRNGSYRAQTTLKQNTVSNGWVDRYTTPLSPFYGVNDVTLEHYGDWAEVALIENLNVAPYFTYSINGKTSSSPVPTIITCPAVPLAIKNVTGGVDNPGTSTITVQKGTLVSGTFDPGSNPIQSATFAATNADQNLYSLFSGLSAYAGALRVSYKIPDDVCGGMSTSVSKTMTITVATAAFLNDYKARNPNASPCSGTLAYKDITTDASSILNSTMPTSTDNNTFKCQLRSRIGWYGAASAGITNLNFVGSSYSVDVYEVNSAGNRLPGAPSLYLNSGVATGVESLEFNYFGNAASFNSSSTYAPYYVDPNNPADASGNGSGGDYFKGYYAWAKAKVVNGTDLDALTNFSAKIFCAEVSQFPAGGCVVNVKSFFRIANNGAIGNGGNLRQMTSGDDETEEEYPSLDIYPNPTKGELIIPLTEDDRNVSVSIMDNLGKEVLNLADVKNGHITIEKLTAGIYFYTIQKNGNVYRGKVVKE